MPHKEACSCNYAVFSFVTEKGLGPRVPVGVVLWSADRRWYGLRLVGKDERLKTLPQDWPIINLVREQLEEWLKAGSLPYASRPIAPWSTAWWEHVQRLLIHRVRLSEPRAIAARDPEQELEPLYEAVVGGQRSPQAQRAHIDGEIRKCLARLAGRFPSRQRLPGYGGREVQVLRAYRGARSTVIIEGINLASPQAEQQVDATVSRLLRVRAGTGPHCEIMVGYIASPEGLNGEAVLLDWLREQTKAHTFDLAKERDELRATAGELLLRATGQQLIS